MANLNLELTPSALLSRLHSLLSSHFAVKNKSSLKILVAYSGGVDSHVLLHLLSRIPADALSLRAIYVDHGLQADSQVWAKHCEGVCQNLDVSYTAVSLNLDVPKAESIEEYARKARYQCISENLLEDEILLTAHHQNDQAETLLLQLFRGSGVQGLASMPFASKFNPKQSDVRNTQNNLHLRPLLDYSRDALEVYAEENNLGHIEDPSNKDTLFDRNFLRQDIMPVLRERWQSIDKTISRSAKIQAETKDLLDQFAKESLPQVLSTEQNFSVDEDSLALAPIGISALKEQSLIKQRLLLRYWISQQGFNNPSDLKLMHIFTDLIDAADDSQPLIRWHGAELRRYQDCLFIMSPLSDHDASQVLLWDINQSLTIESLQITLDFKIIEFEVADTDSISVRFRQGGEKIEIPKRGNISLKKK